MFPHTFPCSLLPSAIRKCNRNCNPCAHRCNFRAGRNCGHRRRNRLLTPIHDGRYAHCITKSGTNQHHSVRRSIQRKLVKAMELQFRVRVVGGQDANHVLIRVRHRSRTSPCLQSKCCTRGISPNHSRSLAPPDLRTETTSLLTTILWLIVGSTHSPPSFDVTLNSSMMLSSLFAVVQSSEPHCPPCLAWAALTTSSSTSQPHLQFPLLTSCSRTPATLTQCTLPVSCLVTRHLFGLCTEPGRTSPFVTLTLGTVVLILRVILT